MSLKGSEFEDFLTHKKPNEAIVLKRTQNMSLFLDDFPTLCFSFQSEIEKRNGLPLAPFMDRERVTKSSSQIGFIRFVLLPLYEAINQVVK